LGPQNQFAGWDKTGVILPFPAQKGDFRRTGKIPGSFQGQGQGAFTGKHRFPGLGGQAAGE
jgi:hypothetical protein